MYKNNNVLTRTLTYLQEHGQHHNHDHSEEKKATPKKAAVKPKPIVKKVSKK